MPPLDTPPAAPAAPTDSAPATAQAQPLADAYLRHHAWLTKVLTVRYGAAEAADIAQDTWLRIQAAAPATPIRSPKAFLMRVAKGLAIDRFRRARFETPTAPDHAELIGRPVEDAQEQAVLFEQMMLALPPKLRDVFVLNHVTGLTYREIAQLRGLSVKAVEKRMTQAIARCAEMLRG